MSHRARPQSLVEVESASDVFSAEVESLHGESLRLHLESPVPAREGDLARITWVEGATALTVSARVLRVLEDYWEVLLCADPEVVQRRDAVRAPLVIPVDLTVGCLDLEGRIVNLSEGGACCVVEVASHAGLLEAGMPATLSLPLSPPVSVAGSVARVEENRSLTRLGLSFSSLSEKESDFLRAQVFAALRAQRARDLCL